MFRARSLVVSYLCLETKDSRLESGCYLCAEIMCGNEINVLSVLTLPVIFDPAGYCFVLNNEI